jgi:hypothetical protein
VDLVLIWGLTSNSTIHEGVRSLELFILYQECIPPLQMKHN